MFGKAHALRNDSPTPKNEALHETQNIPVNVSHSHFVIIMKSDTYQNSNLKTYLKCTKRSREDTRARSNPSLWRI